MVGQASAYRVIPADPDKYGPYELYFWESTEWKGPIPAEQEDAVMAFNHFASVMRQALAQDKKALDLYYQKLCTAAGGAFNEFGYHPQGLRQLETYKMEIVRLVGPKLRSTYLKRMRKVAVWSALIIFLIAVGVDRFIKWGSESVPSKSSSADGRSPFETNSTPAAADAIANTTNNSKGVSPPDKVDLAKSGQSTNGGSGEIKVQKARLFHWDEKFSVLNLGILLAASMIGLLFASLSRGMNLTFDELLTPLEDLLPAWMRFTFYGTAIFILGAFFQQEWLTVSVGGHSFSTSVINESPVAALLFGLLLGIAERAVLERVIKLAAEVVRPAQP